MPSQSFKGIRAGIQFDKGTTGEVELTEFHATSFKEAGYEVIEVVEEKKAKKKQGE